MEFEGDGFREAFAGRTMDIELGGQEIITIDLDTLESDPSDLIDLLNDAQCEVSTWTKLTCEYIKKGLVEAADKIARKALQVFKQNGASTSFPPTYFLLANIQLSLARKAPKLILPHARRDDMSKEKAKEFYHQAAAEFINHASVAARDGGSDVTIKALLIRGIHQLATTSMDDALGSFEDVLEKKPTNLVALLGKARVLFARRQYPQSLKLLQQVLMLSPNCVPDPRIGIGLCFWALEQKAKAKAAWERSLEVNPNQWVASLLLGLEAMNISKNQNLGEDEQASNYVTGIKYVEKAFKLNQRNASAANALFDHFLRKDTKKAHKFAERTIQTADILALLAAGHIHAGQLAQADDQTSEAVKHYNTALKSNPKNVLAAIGLAQMQIKNDEIAAAIHTLDTLIQPPNPQRPLEALVMLASLRGNPRPGVSSADAILERAKARDLYEQVMKVLDGSSGDKYAQRKALLNFGDDVDMFVEIARLWQEESHEKLRSALQEAVRASEVVGSPHPQLLNNLAVVKHLDGQHADARAFYEAALTSVSGASGLSHTQTEATSTTVLYNLARVYEDQGEAALAKEAYDKLLARHPEYIDAKIRRAQLFVDSNRIDDAHEQLKQCLLSQKLNLNLRATYSQFLVERQLWKPAREFIVTTLKEVDSHDVYALCAAGFVYFQQARENRDSGSKANEDRRKNYLRAADVYEKALALDPTCAVAAQGLAIIAAEDVLDFTGAAASKPGGVDIMTRRLQNARDALDILGKVRESIGDASVYINMGHCYFIREEYDRAIESYETASKRRHAGLDVTVLHCLCRAWYAKANKDQSHPAIKNALMYAEKALHLYPSEKVNLYNVAMIEQKGLEMLLSIAPSKRSLQELQRAIEQGLHAQKLFASLAAEKSSAVPYDRDVANQRRKYGDSLMRRVDDNLESQRQYESEQEAKVIQARQKRQEEKERQEEEERKHEEDLKMRAARIAEERKKAREEAHQWSSQLAASSDDEKEKRPRKAKRQPKSGGDGGGGSGDEGAGAAPEPKKRRKGKLRKDVDKNGNEVGAGETGADEEEEALFSGAEEGDEKPVKKRAQKKRVVRDEDEDETATGARPKKQFKSKETISDSDEEMS